MDERNIPPQIIWPVAPNYSILLYPIMVLLWPWGIIEIIIGIIRRAVRRKIKRELSALLISSADYIAGYPLLSKSGRILLILFKDRLLLYKREKGNTFSYLSTFPLSEILTSAYEFSLFVQTILDNTEYTISLGMFDMTPAVEWHNLILSLQYKNRISSLS